MKLFALLVLALAACTVDDARPQTFSYINETILIPSCGTTLCHSAMKKAGGYAFDSEANTLGAFALSIDSTPRLVTRCEDLLPPEASPCGNHSVEKSYLMNVMTTGDAYGNRMPLDQPVPSRDLALIASWIDNGADGYTP